MTETARAGSLGMVEAAMFGSAFSPGFDDFMTGFSKRRRGSVRSLERVFLQLAEACQHLFEIGANDGRHTRRFIAGFPGIVHAFEPNPFLYHHFRDIRDERLRLNTFALGDTASVVERFYIPSPEITGVSSLNMHRKYPAANIVGVSVQRADDYVSKEAASGGIAAWVDVEGNADRVVEGFGDALSRVDVMLLEVETTDYYNRTPSFERVVELFSNCGLRFAGRDWMNRGQFNLLMVREGVANPATLDDYLAFVSNCSRAYAASFDAV
ncbi:FkbM family methyltransferase [Brevundimonas lutea]|uniref:FkbM family methyltransferase n=1 Tax=Brevundimonas lutea TaxID=2293980 RepID=UPI000F041F55|nr:FkbM family methyltransferase [Brevundimonas lutea]